MHAPEPGSIEAKILVAHGAADPFVPPEQIEAFKKEMDAAGADYRFGEYEGVMHSFTNPDADSYGEKFDLPLKYDAEADRQSWQAMQDLFDEAFAAAPATEAAAGDATGG
jgi:dienelactone hydrolase